MIGQVFEKKSALELKNYMNKGKKSKYLGGTISTDLSDSVFLDSIKIYDGEKKIKKKYLHFVLSAPAINQEMPLTDSEWMEAAKIYLEKMGIDTSSHGWAVVKHDDTSKPHIHIFCTKNDLNNKTWKTSFSKMRNVEAVASVEEKLMLTNQQSSNQFKKNQNRKLTPFEIKPTPQKNYHLIKREKKDFFSQIQNSVGFVVDNNKNLSISQFKRLLAQYNVDLEVRTDTKNQEVRGLVFSTVDPPSHERHSVKASDLGSKFLWKNLQKKKGFINDLVDFIEPIEQPQIKVEQKISPNIHKPF